MLGGSLSGRGRPDAKMMPTPGQRAATWRAKSAPLIAPGMLTSVKSSLMSASVSKNRRASSALSASSTGYPASMNMSDAPIRSKTSSSTTRTAAGEGESVTDGNQHRPRWFHVCPDYKTGTRSYRTGHQRGAVSPELVRRALHSIQWRSAALKGAPLATRRDRRKWSILYRLISGTGRTLASSWPSNNSRTPGPGAWLEILSEHGDAEISCSKKC
jgi:hypothetical protein